MRAPAGSRSGCGDFAFLAKEAGFEVQTIEIDARCCEFLTEQVGVRAVGTNDIGQQPSATINSSTRGSIERMDATNG